MAGSTSFLDLPYEIRSKIYGYLLISPVNSITLRRNNVFHPHSIAALNKATDRTPTFRPGKPRWSFHTLHPAILATCSTIYVEAFPLLYTSHDFDCSTPGATRERLRSQIGHRNFLFITHLTLNWCDLKKLAGTLQNKEKRGEYASLVSLTFKPPLRLSAKPSAICGLFDHCLSVQDVLRHHPRLRLLAQSADKAGRWARGNATEFTLTWRLLADRRQLARKVCRLALET